MQILKTMFIFSQVMFRIFGDGNGQMGKGNLISWSFWLIVSVIFGLESYGLGLGTSQQTGPGFLFFWTAIFLGILSLSIIVEAWRIKKGGGI